MGNRLARATIAFSMFVGIYAANVPSPLYVIYQHRFGFSSLVVTELFAGYSLGVLAVLVFAAQYSDRVGRKPVLVAGAVVLLISDALFLLANGAVVLFVARAVQGGAIGVLSSAATAALVELESEQHRSRAALLNVLMFTAGGALGSIVTGLLAQDLPDKTVLSYLVVVALNLVALIGLLALREPERHRAPGAFRIERPSVPRSIRRPFVIASLVIAIGWSVGGIYGSLSPSLVRDILHEKSHLVAGAVLCLFNLVGGAVQLVFRNRSPRWAMTVTAVTTILGAVLIETSLYARAVPLFFFATVFSGTGAALSFVGSLALINAIAPPGRRAEIVSAYGVIGYLALCLPGVGIGLLSGHLGLNEATGVFVGVVVLACVVALGLLGPRWYGRRRVLRSVEEVS